MIGNVVIRGNDNQFFFDDMRYDMMFSKNLQTRRGEEEDEVQLHLCRCHYRLLQPREETGVMGREEVRQRATTTLISL